MPIENTQLSETTAPETLGREEASELAQEEDFNDLPIVPDNPFGHYNKEPSKWTRVFEIEDQLAAQEATALTPEEMERLRVDAGLIELATSDPAMYESILKQLRAAGSKDNSYAAVTEFKGRMAAADDEATKKRLLVEYGSSIGDPLITKGLEAQVALRRERIRKDPLLRMAVMGAVTQPVDPESTPDELDIRKNAYTNWLDYLKDAEETPHEDLTIGERLIDMARGTARGPVRALEETADAIGDLWDSFDAKISDTPLAVAVEENKHNPVRLAEEFFRGLNKEVLGETSSLWGDVPELLVSFIVGFSKYSKLMESAGVLSGPGTVRFVARSMMASAGAGLTTQPTEWPPAQILLKMMFPNEEAGTLASAIEALQHQETDSEIVKRLKTAAGDAGFGAVFDVVVRKIIPALWKGGQKKVADTIIKRQRRDAMAAMAGDRKRAAYKIAQDLEAMPEADRAAYIADNMSPRPLGGLAENSSIPVPEEVLEAQKHLDSLATEALARAAQIPRRAYTPQETEHAMEQIYKEVEAATRATVRPFGSEIGMMPNGEGVIFKVLLGANKRSGFSSLDETLERAARLDPSFENTQILKVNEATGKLEPWPEGPWGTPTVLQKLDDLVRRGEGTTTPGEFYIQTTQERFWHPTDALVMGEDAVIYSGMTARYLLPPRSQFKDILSGIGAHATWQERGLIPAMQAIIRDDFFGQTKAIQREAMAALKYAEEFGKKTGRKPSYSDLAGQFPDISVETVKAYQSMSTLGEVLYNVNNGRLYRDWKGRGFFTLSNSKAPGTAFDGKPLPIREVPRNSIAYHPETKTATSLTRTMLKELYARGGAIIEMALPVARKDHRFTYVVADPDTGWRLGNLRPNPLEYIPGYIPRIYKDKFFIKRSYDKGTLNGRVEGFEEAVFVAPTRKEAEMMLKRLERNTKYKFTIEDDAAMLDKDRTAADLQAMRVEGRIIFDDRADRLLKSVRGGPAETLDPVEAYQRAIWATARGLTHEDPIRVMKQRFAETYGHLLEARIDQRSSSQIARTLSDLAHSPDKAVRTEASKARPAWDYIRLMEGSTGADVAKVRSKFVSMADWVDMHVGSGKTGRAAAEVGNWLTRNVKPLALLKRLSFTDFIVSRPSRQLILQAAQHSFIAPLAPKYWLSGSWYRDTIYLSRALSPLIKKGEVDWETKVFQQGADALGVSLKEYQDLIKRVHNSGVLQTIDANVFGGGVTTERAFKVPKTLAGDVGYSALEVLESVETSLRKGFDIGEAFNIKASYMMALKKFRDKSGKTLSEFTDQDWDNITLTASDLGMGMQKANTSKYAQGFLSVPTQFLSFTHKTWATMLGYNPAVGTLSEGAWKLWVGSYLLFGMNMFGMKEEITNWLAEQGYVGGNSELEDLLLGGAVDYVFDKSAQLAFGPDSDMPMGEFLSPTGGLAFITKKAVENAMELSMFEAFMGPSLATTSRIWKGAELGAAFFNSPDLTPVEKATIITNEIGKGFFSGWNDLSKATVAYETKKWYSNYGEPLAPATDFQVVMRSVFGMSSDEVNEIYAARFDSRSREQAIDTVARDIHTSMKLIASQYYNEETTYEQAQRAARTLGVFMSDMDEDMRYAIGTRVLALEAREPEMKSVADYITEGLLRNMPGSLEGWVHRINKSGLSNEDKKATIEYVQRMTTERDKGGKDLQTLIEEDARRTQ